ncbi:MAG TPA: SLBB domain-containing protein [Vicinamibacteria bacterium]|nr:SLBB domain-containing protein [Vicinamibacteria bacterium]
MTPGPPALGTLLVVLLGQAPAGPATAYRVGPGDVLEVTVAGRPDLARLPTVQTTGMIWIGRLPEGIRVEGLTPLEIAAVLTELLARRELTRPEVKVVVEEYRSQSVWVAGEVNRPGRKALKAGMRVLDVLVEAGGFTTRASGEVRLQRQEGTFEDGSTVHRLRISRTSRISGGPAELETALRRGDIVTAALARYVTVTGEVLHPGRYPLEGEATLRAILSAAGGLTRLASRRVKVDRRDPASTQVRVLQADLEAIEKGRAPDLVLLADDHVEVRARLL